jgi:hypothetical protein
MEAIALAIFSVGTGYLALEYKDSNLAVVSLIAMAWMTVFLVYANLGIR